MVVNCVWLNDNSDDLNKVVDFQVYRIGMKIKGQLGTLALKWCWEGNGTISSFELS